MHPSLTRPYLLSEPPLHTDIIHYENIPKFELVRQNILRYGIRDARLNISSPLGTRSSFRGAFREHYKCRTVLFWFFFFFFLSAAKESKLSTASVAGILSNLSSTSGRFSSIWSQFFILHLIWSFVLASELKQLLALSHHLPFLTIRLCSVESFLT